MGTRGFIGFVAGDHEKVTYNHWDSYPEGLGSKVLQWLRHALADEQGTKAAIVALREVKEDATVPVRERRRLAKYTDRSVGGPTKDGQPNYYQALRQTQGEPAAILDAGIYCDSSSFPLDSLFAEWGYVVDFDARQFEVYRGFQHAPHNEGRFASRLPEGRKSYSDTYYPVKPDTYYPVKLVAKWGFDELPDDAHFLAATNEDEEG